MAGDIVDLNIEADAYNLIDVVYMLGSFQWKYRIQYVFP